MSDLTAFRDHARAMANAEHKPECPSLPKNQPYWPRTTPLYDEDGNICALAVNGPPPPAPRCAGCLTAEERDTFTRLADEIDAYLARDPEVVGRTDNAEEPLW